MKATQAQIFEYFSRVLWEGNPLELDENILTHFPADAKVEPFGESMMSVNFADGSEAQVEIYPASGAGISFEIT